MTDHRLGRYRLFVCWATLLLTGCTTETSRRSPADGGSDRQVPALDQAAPDGAAMDGALESGFELGGPDSAVVDSAVADAATGLDGSKPDAIVADQALLDSSKPDSSAGLDAAPADLTLDAQVQPDGSVGLPVSPPSGKSWVLTFSDEFNGTSLDSSKWNVRDNQNYGTGGHEDQCYRTQNVSVAGGQLLITAKKQTVQCGGINPDRGDKTYFWTSGFITTRKEGSSFPLKFAFTHGYAEARIQMPPGNPWWNGFWLVGSGEAGVPGWPDYGEFDITELVSFSPDTSRATLHYDCGGSHCSSKANIVHFTKDYQSINPTSDNINKYVGATQTGFHRYGLYWTADQIEWYLDGVRVKTITTAGTETLYNLKGQVVKTVSLPTGSMAAALGYPHSIHLNLSVGGDFPTGMGYTGTDSTPSYTDGNLWYEPTNSAMRVDYVRVFELQ